jgi:hypothetical protein
MKYRYFLFLVIFYNTGLQAQVSNDSILKDFTNFIKIPESNVYLHLNKSVLMQGEDLGFAAYVLDHKKQRPSLIVKNLYSQLLNSDSEVVKEQLLLVDQGKAQGVFELDSLVVPGNYTVRAFTNWMKNFKSPHYFEAPIKVLSPDQLKQKQTIVSNGAIDLQIMPEGGSLVENVLSTIGISIRNEQGQPIGNAVVEILENNKVLNQVALDRSGLGRFALKPLKGRTYKLQVDHQGTKTEQLLPEIFRNGVALSVRDSNKFIFIGLNTNKETLKTIKGQEYLIVINSHDQITVHRERMEDLENVIRISTKDLNSGIHQISLFTSGRQLLSQRLYFNHKGFAVNESHDISITRRLDTLETQVSFDVIKNAQISISVHPTTTKALDKSQSIVSSLKLNPYLRGAIQNSLHYLKEVTLQKKYDLDNLLLCHGWVLYDWKDIFTPQVKFKHIFETGINVNVNLNSEKHQSFMIYPSLNNEMTTVDLEKEDKRFIYQSYYPMENEKLNISGINRKGAVQKTALLTQFFPSSIPAFSKPSQLNGFEFEFEKQKEEQNNYKEEEYQLKPFAKGLEVLDTVLLAADKMEIRNEKIRNNSRGRVDFFDDRDRRDKFQMDFYLSSKGFRAEMRNGRMYVSSLSRRFGTLPVLILDGALYTPDYGDGSLDILNSFDMSVIDYVEIVNNGPRNQLGQTIIINTDPALSPFKLNRESVTSFDVPLTFTLPKKFFKPAYYSYNDDFFDKLGVIDWQSDITVVDGKASFTMPYLGKDKLLFHIQGWTEDGELIDEYREVEVENKELRNE